jgi:AcrR family transcriptional regulator
VADVDTRQHLLDAAWACVRTQGVGATTSRAITEAAGANLAAITYHFGSKDALVAQAVVAAIDDLVAPAVDALADEALDPPARVLAAVAHLRAGLAEVGGDAPAYLEAVLQARHSPELAAPLASLFGRLRAGLDRQMRAQLAEGALPPWVDPHAMAGLLLAVAQGVVVESLVDPAGPGPDAMATQFAALLLAARQG